MSKVFRVCGYFNDNGDSIDGYLISEVHGVPEGYIDEDIFYHGVSEENIIGQHDDFTVTSYEVWSDV